MKTVDLVYLALLTIATILMVYRLVKGPDTPNRVMALDTITTLFIALFVLFALVFDRSFYMDVAVVYAIISFVGVLVVARFIERGL
ncbi:MAG: cation:proton antiporter [Caldisericum sp.]|jgi:multicomponent Na+:H+ antiporter subunit F|nr:cation:proton antiporter [Caldisericum sp.]